MTFVFAGGCGAALEAGEAIGSVALDDRVVPEGQDLVDRVAVLVAVRNDDRVDALVDAVNEDRRFGMRATASVQYCRNAVLPRTTPPVSGKSLAATGDVNTTSSWKSTRTASTS